mmetsp:Transcript_20822/g.37957  ORF Transcript_20822/g.37957 Transcript_20822/m.37957 type:complete len:214 (+) Transcript_20822:412-1053(+)
MRPKASAHLTFSSGSSLFFNNHAKRAMWGSARIWSYNPRQPNVPAASKRTLQSSSKVASATAASNSSLAGLNCGPILKSFSITARRSTRDSSFNAATHSAGLSSGPLAGKLLGSTTCSAERSSSQERARRVVKLKAALTRAYLGRLVGSAKEWLVATASKGHCRPCHNILALAATKTHLRGLQGAKPRLQVGRQELSDTISAFISTAFEPTWS